MVNKNACQIQTVNLCTTCGKEGLIHQFQDTVCSTLWDTHWLGGFWRERGMRQGSQTWEGEEGTWLGFQWFFPMLSQLLFLLQLFVFNFVQLYSNWNDTRKPSSRRRWKEHMTWFSLLDHWEQWLIVCMEDTLHILQKLTFMSCFRFLVASCFVTAIFIEEINCHKRFQHHDYYSF